MKWFELQQIMVNHALRKSSRVNDCRHGCRMVTDRLPLYESRLAESRPVPDQCQSSSLPERWELTFPIPERSDRSRLLVESVAGVLQRTPLTTEVPDNRDFHPDARGVAESLPSDDHRCRWSI